MTLLVKGMTFFADDTCVYVTVEHPDTAAKHMETIIKMVRLF